MKAAKTILGIVLCLFLIVVLIELLPWIFGWIWQLLFFVIPILFVGAIIYGIMRIRQTSEIERRNREAEKNWKPPEDRS